VKLIEFEQHDRIFTPSVPEPWQPVFVEILSLGRPFTTKYAPENVSKFLSSLGQ
jgi:hypothetical protein